MDPKHMFSGRAGLTEFPRSDYWVAYFDQFLPIFSVTTEYLKDIKTSFYDHFTFFLNIALGFSLISGYAHFYPLI
jgi:hypothetical protein